MLARTKLGSIKGRSEKGSGATSSNGPDCGNGGAVAKARPLTRSGGARLALVVVVALGIAQAGCGSGDGDPAAEASTQPESSKTPPPRFAHFVQLSSCPVKGLPHGGGSDVRTRGLSCDEVGRLLPRFGLPIGRNDPKSGVFDRGNGWTCWAQFLRTAGPVQNVCWREDEILVYKYE